MRDRELLERLAAGCRVIVHCAGPFIGSSPAPLRAAIRTGADYVDIAEDREHMREVRTLEEQIRGAGIAALAGMSVAPAMEALFTEALREDFGSLHSVRTFAAPDTRKHRGPAMFRTMLTGVGWPFIQPGEAGPRRVRGWTEPEWVEFPPPLGSRLTYLVLEMSDLDLLPELFGVGTVEFKVGTEWPFLNRSLGLAARTRAATGWPNWEKFTPLVRAASWLIGQFGKDEGGVIFEVRGSIGSSVVTRRISVVARRDGGLIPSVLAGIAVDRLLSGRLDTKGIVPVNRWIPPEELIWELENRGLEVWWEPHQGAGWQAFDLPAYRKRRNA